MIVQLCIANIVLYVNFPCSSILTIKLQMYLFSELIDVKSGDHSITK